MFLFGTTPRGIRLYIARKLHEGAGRRHMATEAEGDEGDEEDADKTDTERECTGKKKDRRAEREKRRLKEEQKRRRHTVLGSSDAAVG